MCLNETYSKVRVGKHLSDSFPVQNGLKQGDALSPLLFYFASVYAAERFRLCGLVVIVLGYRLEAQVRFLALPEKKISGSGTGSTQPCEYN
jgi:hypothetical protein